MPLSHMRILVIEDEFLIAMDAERILLDAGADKVVLSARKDLPETLKENRFDIVLLDIAPNTDNLVDEIEMISRTGAKLAFVTSDEDLLSGVPGHDPHLVISKPYDDKKLAALIEMLAGLAARERAQSNSG